MFLNLLLLVAGLALILLAAEFFTNGIEAFGRHFSFSQAVVGSIFAAVGTALPETILPVVAIFFYGGESAGEIGVGAILGAPFMLSTLAFFLVGLTTALSTLKKRRKFELHVEIYSLRRDLSFFLVMYSLAVIVPLFSDRALLIPIAMLLVAGYVVYAWMTFHGESEDIGHAEEVYIWRLYERFFHSGATGAPLLLILLQVAVSLAAMITGARIFVESLGWISMRLGMNPLLFSLLLAPFATELPEKFNSVTWTWKGRDTLAMGNITGAMVFQSTFPVSVGLLFTDWRITGMALFSALLAMLSAVMVLLSVTLTKRVSPRILLFSGSLYLVYLFAVLLR
jgi:cation:H+ antiporter